QTHLDPGMNQAAFNKLLYRNGALRFIDMVVLYWAHHGASNNAEKWMRLISDATKYVRPKMPINGHDLQTLGLSGTRLGQVLRAIEEWWADRDFAPGRDALLARARELAKS